MSKIVNEQLKPINLEIKYLIGKANAQNGKLDRKSQNRLHQLWSERDELMADFLFHTY